MQSNICAFVSVICAYVYLPSWQRAWFNDVRRGPTLFGLQTSAIFQSTTSHESCQVRGNCLTRTMHVCSGKSKPGFWVVASTIKMTTALANW